MACMVTDSLPKFLDEPSGKAERGGARGGLNQRRAPPLFRPPLTPPNLGGETKREI